VEEQGDTLSIRRGNVGVQVPYSDVQGIEVLKIGITIGAKLVFSKANSLGLEIGFFLTIRLRVVAAPIRLRISREE